MAEPVYLKLKLAEADVAGESRKKSLEREGTIECLSWDWGVSVPIMASGERGNQRQHMPIVITKEMDASTPYLIKGLCENANVDLATFKFFRPPRGKKTKAGAAAGVLHYYTVEITNGYVASIKQTQGEGNGPNSGLEEVTFMYENIKWVWESDPAQGASHTDSFGEGTV
jgi:type VI secretion system secreted protein Hcp